MADGQKLEGGWPLVGGGRLVVKYVTYLVVTYRFEGIANGISTGIGRHQYHPGTKAGTRRLQESECKI